MKRIVVTAGAGFIGSHLCETLLKAGGLIKLMESGYAPPVNLGNPNEMTINQFAKVVLKLTGTKSKLVQKGLPEDNPVKRKPDISLAKSKLGWEPKVGLEQGCLKQLNGLRKAKRCD